MTRRTIRASAAALGGAALLALAGCGGSSTATTQSTAAQSTAAQGTPAQGAQQQGRAGGGPFAQIDQSALAKDLGVSTTQLQQALAAARPAGPPNGTPPAGGQGSGPPAGGGGLAGQMAANLAKQLNLPTSKVQQALAKYLPARPQGAAPQAPSTSQG